MTYYHTFYRRAVPARIAHIIISIKPDLNFIFDLIYRNQLPDEIRRYFTDVYLFCLHKDPTDATKLRPLGIPTAIRRLIASHVARTLRDKFSQHLLPYNYAVGVPKVWCTPRGPKTLKTSHFQ
jgi:hypothetical protein